MLQRVAAHHPPALPDQLGFWALHTRSGTRGARLGPSGCEHRHCTCRAISGATRNTWHPLRLLHLGWWDPVTSTSLSWVGVPQPCWPPSGASRDPATAATPCGSESAQPRPAGPGRFKATAAPPPLRPPRRAHLSATSSGMRRLGGMRNARASELNRNR